MAELLSRSEASGGSVRSEPGGPRAGERTAAEAEAAPVVADSPCVWEVPQPSLLRSPRV